MYEIPRIKNVRGRVIEIDHLELLGIAGIAGGIAGLDKFIRNTWFKN